MERAQGYVLRSMNAAVTPNSVRPANEKGGTLSNRKFLRDYLTGFLVWPVAFVLFWLACGTQKPQSAKLGAPASPKFGATASPHNIAFTWTASTSNLSGLGYNLYFGSSSGAESTAPVNTSLLTTVCSGTSCTATIYATGGTGGAGTSPLIVSMATVYATVKACVPNAGLTTCSTPSNEVSCTIPLASSDINPPASLAGVAQ